MTGTKDKTEAMREGYGQALAELGAVMPEVVVLDADVSASTKTGYFKKRFPERFINFGIAEQNMMSAAAGMATAGLVPFVNSFSFLTTYRAADQFRTSVVYPRLNVKVAATYGGLSDSFDGPTHQTVADIAWVRALPNLCVIVPADSMEARKALPVIAQYKGPVWLRLCRAEIPVIFDDTYKFVIGKGAVLREGTDVTLVGCGVAVSRILTAAQTLSEKGIHARVLSMSSIKPFDSDLLIESAKMTGPVVTVEEHSVMGGLGAAVCEILSDQYPVPVKRLGIPDTFAESGPYEDLLNKYGLAVQSIVDAAEGLLRKGKK